CQQHNSYPPTV
nr:immunoglobulin light chain junction region [Macaca mulatta]